MKKWKQFPAITARRRRPNSPDRHYQEFHQTLQSLQQRYRKDDSIRAYCWTVKYAAYADMPQLSFIILLHHAATTACTSAVANALAEAFEDIAYTAVVVTFSRKAFLRIAQGHLLP
jgi:DNA-binding ferritin-like protein (Dps family)